MPVNIQTLENNRAKFAFEEIKKIRDKLTEKQRKEFKSWAKKIAVMVKMNGLGQTMAFLKSKTKENDEKEKHYRFYYELTEKWLKEKKILTEKQELLDSIVQINSVEYRRYTRETLALFNWVRRFADGYL
ncbi:MAG: hypothetical protein Kow0042_20670 [Calditrichia bacterium]